MYFPSIKAIENIVKDQTLRSLRPWWVVLGGAAILFWTPAQAILESQLTGAFFNWFASFIPSIGRWVELSPFPYNTKLFAVFIWAMIPVHTYWLISSGNLGKQLRVNNRESKPASLWLRVLVFLQFLIFVCAFVLIPWNFAIVDTPPCRVCVNSNHFAQLFIGCVYSLTLAGLFALLVEISPLIFRSPSTEENKNV